jgi:hypothetical protein
VRARWRVCKRRSIRMVPLFSIKVGATIMHTAKALAVALTKILF